MGEISLNSSSAMNSKFMLSFVCLMVLLRCTKEVPVNSSTEFSILEAKEPNGLTNRTALLDGVRNGESTYFEDADESVILKDNPSERSNHSRMLKTPTTLGYDEWWFYTTRRPHLFYKDFPGKPGVATWKEISPSASDENKKSRKSTNPTASGVSSSSWRLYPDHQLTLLVYIGIPLFLFRFRQT